MNRSIYACDVGSTIQGRFAWKRIGAPVENCSDQHSEIEALVESLRRDFGDGLSVALEFEAPLFLPVPQVASQLSRGRVGESIRSCFAPAGASGDECHPIPLTLIRRYRQEIVFNSI
jgi:hypothetical protein